MFILFVVATLDQYTLLSVGGLVSMKLLYAHDLILIPILGAVFVYRQYRNSRNCSRYKIPFGTLHYDTCRKKQDFKVHLMHVVEWPQSQGLDKSHLASGIEFLHCGNFQMIKAEKRVLMSIHHISITIL